MALFRSHDTVALLSLPLSFPKEGPKNPEKKGLELQFQLHFLSELWEPHSSYCPFAKLSSAPVLITS